MKRPSSKKPPRPPRLGPEGEPTVFVADEQEALPIDVERWSRLAHDVLVDEGVSGDAELAVLFVDEATITQLNRDFMDETGPTDVLAFPIDAEERAIIGREPDGGTAGPARGEDPEPPLLLGDIVICPAVAARNATERGIRIDDEIALLTVHGILHVLGHDHREPDETAIMRNRENELLRRHHRSPD